MNLRLLPRAVALLSAALLLCLYRPHVQTTARAEGKDEVIWRGTVTVVDTINVNDDTTNQVPIGDGGYIAGHHINREQSRRSYAYSGIQSAPDSDTSWAGPANVNLNINREYYSLEVEKRVLPAYVKDNRISTHEVGFESTTSGATVAQGEVKFYRTLKEDNPRLADCRIEVDAQEDWRDRPELVVWLAGHHWDKWDKSHEENDQRTREILAPIFVGTDFDCDPKASSYSGEKREKQGNYTRVVTWNIHGGPEPETEVELYPPQGYDHWLPQADEDEETLGNYIDVRILAHKKGDPNADPPRKVLKYKIELEDTSKEKGVDLNWPPKSRAKDTFDMKIDKDNPWITLTDDKGQFAETKEEGLSDFTVTVNSYDWGGHTTLRVTAELEDHSSVVAHVHDHPEQEELFLPKDDDHNHLADWWEHQYGLDHADATADDDHLPPGDYDRGDSIALYDEYRGFHIRGTHERLSPLTKDLFVFDPSDLGVGLYGDTGVSTHVIYEQEYDFSTAHPSHQVITPNGTHGDVCAVWLTRGSMDSGVVGETIPGVGVPCNVESVTIGTKAIAEGYGAQAAPGELRSTIAHELSHATNVHHHGESPPDYDVGGVTCRRRDGTVWKPKCPPGVSGECFEVAVKGGKYSGNDQCWMRYDLTQFYENTEGNCQWKHNGRTVFGSLYGQDPPGMTLCDNPRGTGVNDQSKSDNKAGDASPGRGDCKHKFCLNNKKH